MEGTITTKNSKAGFCFIQTDDGTDHFSHAKLWRNRGDFSRCREGDRVTFAVARGNQGPVAKLVQPAESSILSQV